MEFPSGRPQITLLEFDKRFEVFKNEFVFYDFENPIRLPAELKGTFDCVIVDPPFLSEDCQTKGMFAPNSDWGKMLFDGFVC